MNNVLTASRMNSLAACARRHFWQYEVGLRKDEVGLALRFGSAWARAEEKRWLGGSYDEALAFAIPEGVELDHYECATVAALLAGYYDHYGQAETCGKMYPEVKFKSKIPGTDFTAEGVMDSLGMLKDGRQCLIETKTTRDNIDRESDYWIRLRFNVQVLQYLVEAPNLKNPWHPEVAYYDVVRKPQIKPKEVTDLDVDGLKICLDSKGERVYIEKGKKGEKRQEPKQSADTKQGQRLQSHLETPDEFSDRLWKDTQARPDFYFCRYEIPVMDDQLEEFRRHRLGMIRLIEHYRSQESVTPVRDHRPWMRNVAADNCKFCQYKSFCLQNVTPDLSRLPAGFSIKPINPELDKETDDNAEPEDATTAAS